MADDLASTRLEVLHAHYVDTFQHIRQYSRSRERFFFLVLATMLAMFVEVASPETSDQVLSSAVSSFFGVPCELPTWLVGTFVRLCLLAFAVRYFQLNVTIDRQYPTLHMLEEELSSLYSKEVFIREGRAYLSRYDLFRRWLSFVYAGVFPLAIAGSLVFRSALDWTTHYHHLSVAILNQSITLVTLITLVLYSHALLTGGEAKKGG